MDKSKRMQFYYSLYGRTQKKGILKKYNCYKFSDTIILSPIGSSEMIKEFLQKWDIPFLEFPILIPLKIEQYILKKEK